MNSEEYVNSNEVSLPLRNQVVVGFCQKFGGTLLRYSTEISTMLHSFINHIADIYHSVPHERIAAEAVASESIAFAQASSRSEYMCIIGSIDSIHFKRSTIPGVTAWDRIPDLSLPEEALRRIYFHQQRCTGIEYIDSDMVRPNFPCHPSGQQLVQPYTYPLMQPHIDPMATFPVTQSIQQPGQLPIQPIVLQNFHPSTQLALQPTIQGWPYQSIRPYNERYVQQYIQSRMHQFPQPLLQALAHRPVQHFVHRSNQQPAHILPRSATQKKTKKEAQTQTEEPIQPRREAKIEAEIVQIADQKSTQETIPNNAQVTFSSSPGVYGSSNSSLRTAQPTKSRPTTEARIKGAAGSATHALDIRPPVVFTSSKNNAGVSVAAMPVTPKSLSGPKAHKLSRGQKRKVNTQRVTNVHPGQEPLPVNSGQSSTKMDHQRVSPKVSGVRVKQGRVMTSGSKQEMLNSANLSNPNAKSQERVKESVAIAQPSVPRGNTLPKFQMSQKNPSKFATKSVRKSSGVPIAQSGVRSYAEAVLGTASFARSRPLIPLQQHSQERSTKRAKTSQEKAVREDKPSEIIRDLEKAEAAVKGGQQPVSGKRNQNQICAAPQTGTPSGTELPWPIESQIRNSSFLLEPEGSVPLATPGSPNNDSPSHQTIVSKTKGQQSFWESVTREGRAAQKGVSEVHRQASGQTAEREQEGINEKTNTFPASDLEASRRVCDPTEFDFNRNSKLEMTPLDSRMELDCSQEARDLLVRLPPLRNQRCDIEDLDGVQDILNGEILQPDLLSSAKAMAEVGSLQEQELIPEEKALRKLGLHERVKRDIGAFEKTSDAIRCKFHTEYKKPVLLCTAKNERFQIPMLILRIFRGYPERGSITCSFQVPKVGWTEPLKIMRDNFMNSVGKVTKPFTVKDTLEKWQAAIDAMALANMR